MKRKMVILMCVLLMGALAAPTVLKAAEPNTSVTADMSPAAAWFRRNVMEKPLFFIFGILGSAPVREAAVMPQSVNTQMEKARQDGSNKFVAFLYGCEKGVNCLGSQALQEVVQTPTSALVSIGSGFVGNDGYYLVPELAKPHWLARANWSNPWYIHQLEFAANVFGAYAWASGAMVFGHTNHIYKYHHWYRHFHSIGLFGGSDVKKASLALDIAAGVAEITYAAKEGKGMFVSTTDYDRVWQASKK